jgi:phosphoribosylformylglycinamidine synthase
MTAYEILLSESQERMLVCVKKGKEDEVRKIFQKWELDSTIIGYVTDDGLMTVRIGDKVVNQVPSKTLALGGETPVYERETTRPRYMDEITRIDLAKYPLDCDWDQTLLTMLASPNVCHKGWLFEQYDSMVRTNTAVGPGSDAAVLRLRGTDKALAMTTDCNGRYCYINPRVGAQSAVAEAARNIVCSGGQPLAITNCLNFGNPHKPEMYYCFAEAVKGMGEACRVFDTPVTGGNVSFYNEAPNHAVFPTPTIGMIGMVQPLNTITTQNFKADGDAIFLLGTNVEHLGASEYLHTVFDDRKGDVPALNLEFEKRLQDSLLQAIRAGLVRSAHDCSDGGLAVALAEACISDREHMLGAKVTLDEAIRADCLLFGEAQSRVILSCRPEKVDELQKHFDEADVPCRRIGVVGGESLRINDLTDTPLAEMADAWYEAMPRFMEQVEGVTPVEEP